MLPRLPSPAVGIQRCTMRSLRFLFAFVFAFFILGGSQARAGEPSIGPAPASNGENVAVSPHDAPVVTESDVTIPNVPPEYTTRHLGWLTLSYPQAAQARVESLMRDADAIKRELTEAFDVPVLEHVEVRVAPTASDMALLAPRGVPAYASGVAFPRLHLVLLSMLAPEGANAVDLDEVFRHELAHIALEDATLGQHVPAWFNEGLAVGLSGENQYDRLSALWHATTSGTLLPLSDLDRSFPKNRSEVNVAYAESADFVRFLMRRTDRARFSSMIHRVREGHPFERAIADAYGSDLRKLEFQWRTDVEKRYSVIPILTGGGIIWVGVIGALVAAYVKRRRRTKAILARWEREEALEDAWRAHDAGQTERPSTARLMVPSITKAKAAAKVVEHGGRWHTLH